MGGRFTCTATKDGVFKLVITDLCELDNGDIVCEAINSIGFATSVARLKIGCTNLFFFACFVFLPIVAYRIKFSSFCFLAPPRIDRLPGDLYLPENENTKIKIFVSGDQPMTVKLSKDGAQIKESPHIKYTVFDEYIIIFIKEVAKDDSGTYTLECQNESGSASGSFTITTTGLPGPPQGPLDVSDITKHTCTLNWSPPLHNGGLKVTHYVIERRDISLNHWVLVYSFCKETTFTVQGLTDGQEYLFRVMAVNENGMGPPLEGTNPIRAKAPFGKYLVRLMMVFSSDETKEQKAPS